MTCRQETGPEAAHLLVKHLKDALRVRAHAARAAAKRQRAKLPAELLDLGQVNARARCDRRCG